MATLVFAVLTARRVARKAAPLAIAFVLAGLVLMDAIATITWPYAVMAALALLLTLAHRIRHRAKAVDGTTLVDVEIGALLVVATFGAIVRIDGSLDGPAHAMLYVSIGLISAFGRPMATILAVILATAMEVLARWLCTGMSPMEDPLSWAMVGPHVAFMIIFAVVNMVVLRTAILRADSASLSRLRTEMDRLRDDARSYRLLSAPTRSSGMQSEVRQGEDERLARSGVEEIHQSVLLALRLLHEALGLHTAMLLWQNDAGSHLRISELVSDALDVAEGPFLIGDGVLGAVTTQQTPVIVADIKPGYKLPYYLGPAPVQAVCAMPVFEHGSVRGVLVVDRIQDRAFTPREMDLLEEACRYAVRAIQNEREFMQLERAKAEQDKLYRAAEALGASTTEADVVEAGVKSAREITSVDFAAVTLFDETTNMHEIRAVSGDDAGNLVGHRFRQNAGLVSMVLQNRHPLPYRGEYDDKHQIVFTRKVAPPPMPSIVVLPLLVHDRPLGTLVLGSQRRAAFNDSARSTLEVMASHMAVSLSNARMLRRLEELATMDGLTGLLNKRAMLDIAEQKLNSARRFRRQLSVLVADIDHFKNVNDSYGHDTGDLIIKGLSDILRRAKRTTDAVARFGGEEFVLICEETDARGAMLLAERVREEFGRTTFHAVSKSGAVEVHVTCSVGIATFPEAGNCWEELFKAADEALYVSKRSGRNRATIWSTSMQGHAAEAAPSAKTPPTAKPPSVETRKNRDKPKQPARTAA